MNLLVAPILLTSFLNQQSLVGGFEQRTVVDSLKRKITYYVTPIKSESDRSKPIILWIGGSGGQSIWMKVGDKVYGSLHSLARKVASDHARVITVEKPGVEFCFQPPTPGTAEGCSKDFLSEHTLSRWAEANIAALKDVLKEQKGTPLVLVAGHSEGGIVAAKVAVNQPSVTHVASLSGGGPTQLYDMTFMLPKESVYAEWRKIEDDPLSIEKFAWGHPYRRWSTFCKESVTGLLTQFNGEIYIAHGTEDRAVPIQSFDVLVSELTASGKRFTANRVEKGDHGFTIANDPNSGFERVMSLLMEWFIKTD